VTIEIGALKRSMNVDSGSTRMMSRAWRFLGGWRGAKHRRSRDVDASCRAEAPSRRHFVRRASLSIVVTSSVVQAS
jgi:hypothetical protein